jgi:hypothetical protein
MVFLRYEYFVGPINKNFARFFPAQEKFAHWSKNPGYASGFVKFCRASLYYA